jgi:hypothetical protein
MVPNNMKLDTEQSRNIGKIMANIQFDESREKRKLLCTSQAINFSTEMTSFSNDLLSPSSQNT